MSHSDKLEAAFHKRLRAIVSQKLQGYIMGAFRQAIADVGGVLHFGKGNPVDYQAELSNGQWRSIVPQDDMTQVERFEYLKRLTLADGSPAYNVRKLYDHEADTWLSDSVVASRTEELRAAQDRLFDLLLDDDGQAYKEARKYLERKRPDLAERLP